MLPPTPPSPEPRRAEAPAAEPLLELLFDDDSAARCLVAPDGRALRTNRAWRRARGGEREDGEDFRAHARALLERVQAGVGVAIARHRRWSGGRETWWEGRADPVAIPGGTGLLVTLRQVPEAGSTALDSEPADGSDLADDARARLAAIVESTDAAIISKDLRGVILSWNAAAERLLGYRAAEIVGRPIDFIIPTERRAEEASILSRIQAGERVAQFETRRRTKSGGLLDVSVIVSPIRGRDGRVVGASKILRDITALKRAEAATRREHELAEVAGRAAGRRFRAAVENLPVGLLVADLATGALTWNREALALYGYGTGGDQPALEEILAEIELRTPEGEPVPREDWPMRHLLRGERFRQRELLVRHRRLGWERIFSYSGEVVAEPGTAGRMALLAIQDVTSRARAERALRESEEALRTANEKLRETDRRKDDFLGVLSHELRNPLAPIRNALYVLDRVEPGGESARRAREIASRQVLHLTRLVDDLLDVTRIGRGKIQLHLRDLDLALLARRAADDHLDLMRQRGLAFEVALPDGPVPVRADETRVAQVIGNLLTNAAKFTPRGGHIRLSVALEGGAGVVRVSDDGAGMDPGALESMFEPFVQAEQTLARTEGGLGLGLALVKGLAELHGGEARARSAGRGRGAEFEVRLPLRPEGGPREG